MTKTQHGQNRECWPNINQLRFDQHDQDFTNVIGKSSPEGA